MKVFQRHTDQEVIGIAIKHIEDGFPMKAFAVLCDHIKTWEAQKIVDEALKDLEKNESPS